MSVALAIISGTCATLTYPSPAAMLLTFCADVVKYSYFLPTGKTPAQLNAEAEALVYQASFVWPSTCQASIKKLVCASVYLNCTGYDMNDSTNWNVGVYNSSFPVPYKIPCKSTCLNVRMQCNDMPAQQTPPLPYSCLASNTVDYGYGLVARYQQANTAGVCFDTTPEIVQVQGGMEPYLPGAAGVCAGYVGPTIYIPPSNTPGINLAPMTPPGVVQTGIETQLTELFSQLPPTVSVEGYVAMKKYLCSSLYLEPVLIAPATAITLSGHGNWVPWLTGNLTALKMGPLPYINITAQLHVPIVVPAFPAHSICTSYATAAASLIDVLASPPFNVAMVVPNCSALNSVTHWKLWPTGPQPIYPIPLSATVTAAFITAPNTMPNFNNTAAELAYNPVATGPFSVGTCSSFANIPGIANPEVAVMFFCAGVVDYEFFMPPGSTFGKYLFIYINVIYVNYVIYRIYECIGNISNYSGCKFTATKCLSSKCKETCMRKRLLTMCSKY